MIPMLQKYIPPNVVLNETFKDEHKKQSSWLLAPYFTLYFSTYIINALVWPLFLMDRLCNEEHHRQTGVSELLHVNFTSHSCINKYMTGSKSNITSTSTESLNRINDDTLNFMIVGSISAAVLSLLSYFLLWKPTLHRCRPISVFLPPICMICQCVLFSYALTINNTKTFKYVILSGVLLPCLHSNFQGVFLLMFKLTKEQDEIVIKRNREISVTKVEASYATLYISMIVTGIIIGFCFEMSYSVLFVLQFTMSLLTAVYGAMLIPFQNIKCLTGVESNDEENDEENDNISDSSDEEEILLMRKSAQNQQDRGLLSEQGNLFSEAPLIFSETSYKKEMLIIVEISVFTIAVISDSMISGPYLLQSPFKLTIQQYGYCVAAQGLSKLFGVFVTQTIAYFSPCKHGSLIVIAGLNTILYYVLLGIVQDTYVLYVVMVINIFGGNIFPTIASFININFTDTLETVLEISTVSSLIVTVGFHSIQYFVYTKTRNVFPGAIFLLTAAMMSVGFVVAGATYFSTTVKDRRKTKDFADKLLNDYQ